LKHILVTDGGSYGDKELILNHIVTNKSKVAILNDINRLLCDLNNLCILSARQKCRRMEWESEEELLVTSTASASHTLLYKAHLQLGTMHTLLYKAKIVKKVDDHINRYLKNQRGFNIHICMSDSLSISYYKYHINNVDLTSSGIDIDLSSKSKKVVFINAFTDALINSLK
jgi:hypothetical protein